MSDNDEQQQIEDVENAIRSVFRMVRKKDTRTKSKPETQLISDRMIRVFEIWEKFEKENNLKHKEKDELNEIYIKAHRE